MHRTIASSLRIYLTPKLIGIGLLGLASGLPKALITSTLAVWMREEGISLQNIGLFALVGSPYALKFLWAPLVDQLPIPLLEKLLGRRRSWLFLMQIGLAVSIIALGICDPHNNLLMMAGAALAVAIFSATQDIVIDAYRIELLEAEEQGAGASMAVYGWSIGALISGAGALFIAEEIGWFLTYAIMGCLVFIGMAASLWAGEPARINPARAKHVGEWMRTAIIDPFQEFMQRSGWLITLIFIVLYKLGDAYAGVMTAPFVIDLGFTKQEYGLIVKGYGFIAGLVGAFLGGIIVHRYGMMRSLLISGILMMLSNLVFIAQAWIGLHHGMLALTITVENLTGWMGNVVIVAYLSSLCNVRFTATQYALFSALAATGRTWLSASSGFVAEQSGWEGFFLISTIIALPGLMMIRYLPSSKQ